MGWGRSGLVLRSEGRRFGEDLGADGQNDVGWGQIGAKRSVA